MRAATTIVLGLALLAAAALFGSPALYPAGVALLVLPGAAAAWVLVASARARLERSIPSGPLLEGRSYPLLLRADCGLLPPPAGELRDPLLARPLPLGPGAQARLLRHEVRFDRRGRRELGSAELVLGDPFGFSERRISSTDAGELIVLPRIEPLELQAGGDGGDALGRGRQGAEGSGPQAWAAEFEIDGLRPYQPGSPAARIHWPALARTGELHERRITSGADAARLVVLDPQRPGSEEDLDAAVRAAASICDHLARGSGCTLLIGGEPRPLELEPRRRNFAHAHHLLALAEADAGAPAVRRIARAGIVFWVSADPSRGVEQRARCLAAGRRLLIRPERSSGPGTSLFTVAGCVAQELGPGRPRSVVGWSGAAA